MRVGPCRAAHMILSLVDGFHSSYIDKSNNHNSLGHERPLYMSLMCFNTTQDIFSVLNLSITIGGRSNFQMSEIRNKMSEITNINRVWR